MDDPAAAAKHLVDHALSRFSTDNLSCMIVRIDREAHLEAQGRVGTEGALAAARGGEGEGGFRPTALDSTVEEEPGPGEEKGKGENGGVLDKEGEAK